MCCISSTRFGMLHDFFHDFSMFYGVDTSNQCVFSTFLGDSSSHAACLQLREERSRTLGHWRDTFEVPSLRWQMPCSLVFVHCFVMFCPWFCHVSLYPMKILTDLIVCVCDFDECKYIVIWPLLIHDNIIYTTM